MSAPKARENFWYFIQESSLVFLLNNALVYVFPRIQNETLKKECIWVRIRGAFPAKKGAPKLSLHHEGGRQLPPFAPTTSTTEWLRRKLQRFHYNPTIEFFSNLQYFHSWSSFSKNVVNLYFWFFSNIYQI